MSRRTSRPVTRASGDGGAGSSRTGLSELLAAIEQGGPLVLEPFDGSGDIVDWIKDYEDEGRASGWTDELLARRLRKYLRGTATKWQGNLDGDWSTNSWAQLKEKMLAAFAPADYELELHEQLSSKRKRDADPLDFLEDRKRICSKLGMTAKDTNLSIIVGLGQPYYGKLLGKRFGSLDELRNKLKLLVKLEQANQGGSNPRGNQASPSVRPAANVNQAGERLCFGCNQPGHVKADCKAVKPANARKPDESDRSKPLNNYRANYYSGQSTKPTTEKNINKVAASKEYLPLSFYLFINDRPLEAMLDSGAELTVVDANLYESQLRRPTDEPYAASGSVVAAGGEHLETRGTVKMNVRFTDVGGHQYSLRFGITLIEGLRCKILLGCDFMALARIKLDLGSRRVVCEGPKLPPLQVASGQVVMKLSDGARSMADRLKALAGYDDQNTTTHGSQTETAEQTLNCPVQLNATNGEQEIKGCLQVARELAGPLPQEQHRTDGLQSDKDHWNDHPDGDPSMWGRELVLEQPFADDQTEDKNNPYIFEERTRPIKIDEHEVLVGMEHDQATADSLLRLLSQYKEMFAFDGQLGDCDIMSHEIRTLDKRPVHTGTRPRPQREQEAIDQQLQTWLAQGLIRPSRSPWASQVVTVIKKDRTVRCCIDYRPLNAVTERDVYPMPTREEMLGHFNGMKYFSSLDLNQGYMQIRVRESDIPKTAFVVQSGFYEFVRMPFGLTNAPATFQRTMDIVLGGLKGNSCLVYLDDIIVFGASLKAHNEALVKVLDRIREARLTLKPSKCAFAVQQLKFLGHIIGPEGIGMDPDKIRSISDAKVPVNDTEIKSFIGLASYYRSYCPDFASIAEPMNRLTKKDVPFEWKEEQQKSFDTIKAKLTAEPVLCHFDNTLPIELRTDASDYGLGAVLLHERANGQRNVIAYASRLLKAAELNYPVMEKECLAIVWAVDKFRMYLFGVQFTVVTDHQALLCLTGTRPLAGRLARWANLLSPYHFKVVYKSGRLHKDADHLSRFPLDEAPKDQDNEKQVNFISYGRRGTTGQSDHLYTSVGALEEVAMDGSEDNLDHEVVEAAQRSDDDCQEIIANLDRYDEFEMEDGLLVLIDRADARASAVSKIVIPGPLMNRVLKRIHDQPEGGHLGLKKTLHKFKQRYYAPRMSTTIKEYVKTCHECQTKKPGWTRKLGLLRPHEAALRPFQKVGIDTMGPFKRSLNGNKKIIVLTDYHTKWAVTRAVPAENEAVLAEFMVDEIFLRYGAPSEILSDRGQSFSTRMMKEVYQIFAVKHITTTSYHPQTNGLTERLNRTLSTMLAFYVSRQHDDWDRYLPVVTFAYNSAVQASTGFTPFYLMYGHEPRIMTDVREAPGHTNISEHFERLHEARERAVEAARRAQEIQKKQYDKHRYVEQYEEGDLVLIYRPRGYIGQTTKLRHPYEGPFTVVKVYDDLNVRVRPPNDQGGRRAKEDVVHVSRLKKYHRRGESGHR